MSHVGLKNTISEKLPDNGRKEGQAMIKGAKTIEEYVIRKWLQDQNFVMSNFELVVNGNEAVLTDKNNDTMTLVYDSTSKTVYVKE